MDHSEEGHRSVTHPLPSTVQEVLADGRLKFRILVLGKTGCGKSSLINKVFGVDIAEVSHKEPGKADVHKELCPNSNARFVLHDSLGFEPGQESEFLKVQTFIRQRSKLPQPIEERLHAIWICITIPEDGARVIETGVERILEMRHDAKVPVIVVFTKYDQLVDLKIYDLDEPDEDEDILLIRGMREADIEFEETCVRPLKEIAEEVPFVKVSIKLEHAALIAQLIQTTDEQIVKLLHLPSRTEPVSLAWSVAQRGNVDINITASIDVGRKRYWRGLLSSSDFTGQMFQDCLNTIHGDITSVWNIHDPKNLLAGDAFKATLSNLVEDLADRPRATLASNITLEGVVAAVTTVISSAAGMVGAGVVFAKWVLDIYRNTPGNVRCMMGYIVDLTIVMHSLFWLKRSVFEDAVDSILKKYAESGNQAQVHNEIRVFVGDTTTLRLGHSDHVLDEIVRLIKKYCVDPQ